MGSLRDNCIVCRSHVQQRWRKRYHCPLASARVFRISSLLWAATTYYTILFLLFVFLQIKQIRVENQHIPESEVRRLVMLKPDLNPEDPLLAELFGKLNDQYGMHGKNKDKFDEFFGFNYKSLKSYHVKHDCGGSVRRFYERFHENHLTILVPGKLLPQ